MGREEEGEVGAGFIANGAKSQDFFVLLKAKLVGELVWFGLVWF